MASGFSRALEWTLRIGVCMCFVGHGAFGVMTKAAWVPYFAVVGIGPAEAYRLMPLIGAMDIVVGCSMLIAPLPIVGGWMLLWTVWTAALRPLSGESAWEAIERAGNYGVPAAILLLMASRQAWARPFRPMTIRALTPDVVDRARLLLTMVVVLLLIGHGALSVGGKPGIVANFASVVGLSRALLVTRVAGAIEILLALAVAAVQNPGLLVGVAAWKLLTESMFVLAGASGWEIVERGGSYAAPVALAILLVLRGRLAGSPGLKAPARLFVL